MVLLKNDINIIYIKYIVINFIYVLYTYFRNVLILIGFVPLIFSLIVFISSTHHIGDAYRIKTEVIIIINLQLKYFKN